MEEAIIKNIGHNKNLNGLTNTINSKAIQNGLIIGQAVVEMLYNQKKNNFFIQFLYQNLYLFVYALIGFIYLPGFLFGFCTSCCWWFESFTRMLVCGRSIVLSQNSHKLLIVLCDLCAVQVIWSKWLQMPSFSISFAPFLMINRARCAQLNAFKTTNFNINMEMNT